MANAEYIIKNIKRIKNETLKLNNHMLETLSKREDKVGRDMYKGFIKGYERGQKNMEVFFNNRLKLMQSVLAIQELVLNSPDDFIIENETLIIEDEYLLAKFNDLINQYNHYLGEDVVIQEEAYLKLDKSIEKIKNQ